MEKPDPSSTSFTFSCLRTDFLEEQPTGTVISRRKYLNVVGISPL
jgi:hypothetical protein